jgi:hypothetical protein
MKSKPLTINNEEEFMVHIRKRSRKAETVSIRSGFRAMLLALCLLQMTLEGVRGQQQGIATGAQGVAYIDPSTG